MRLVPLLALLLSFSAFAQVSVQEAQAKLAEKEQQRQIDREKIVQITAGELDDLRQRVRQLEDQLKLTRSRTNEKDIKKVYTAIEIGMTKEELLAFVKRSGNLGIIGMNADAGVQRATEQIVRKQNGVSNRDVTVAQGDSEGDARRTRTNTKSDDATSEVIERTRTTGKRETIQIARYGKFNVQTGSQTNSFGQSKPTWGSENRQLGTISVTLVDEVVTAVNAR